MTQKLATCVLLSILVITCFVSIDVTSVNARKVAMEWGHMQPPIFYDNNYVFDWGLYFDTWPWYSYESNFEYTICSNIDGLFDSSGGGWLHQNVYEGLTYDDVVYMSLDNFANPVNNVNYVANWWVGDFLHVGGSPKPEPYGYFACYGEPAGPYPDSDPRVVKDYEIYQHATSNGVKSSAHYFTFMWTCSNGGLYWDSNGNWQNISGITWPTSASVNPPPSNTNTKYGYTLTYPPPPASPMIVRSVGMPYAWTGTTGMPINGYNSPYGSYTFIGWENNSPFMSNPVPDGWSNKDLKYIFFAYYFYRYALGYETYGVYQSVNDSLDYAARMAFGQDSTGADYTFGSSILNQGQWFNTDGKWFYCRLRVFGNGNMVLPKY